MQLTWKAFHQYISRCVLHINHVNLLSARWLQFAVKPDKENEICSSACICLITAYRHCYAIFCVNTIFLTIIAATKQHTIAISSNMIQLIGDDKQNSSIIKINFKFKFNFYKLKVLFTDIYIFIHYKIIPQKSEPII